MTTDTGQKLRWPQQLQQGDDLYAVEDTDTGEVEYLVFSSIEKRATFVRERGGWIKVDTEFINDIDDPKYSLEFVDVDFIDEYDKMQMSIPVDRIQQKPADSAVTAAADDKCPIATSDIAVNLKNRRRAIEVATYGPLNPDEENEEFWQQKADNWSTTPDEAKKSLCGNCVFFVVTAKMRDCIASGLAQGDSSSQNAWDAIDAAELGYCEAFDFKCAASRTCDAWAVGGPITDESTKSKGAEK